MSEKIDHWWRKTLAGENKFGTGRRQHVVGWEERLAIEDPELHALITFLQKRNGPDAEFWIANGLIGTHLNGRWSLDRLRDARQRALDRQWIEMIVEPVQGRHALYVSGPSAFHHLRLTNPRVAKMTTYPNQR